MMMAFDLDGVLIPDCDDLPNVGGVDEFYEVAYAMRPMFQPPLGSALITGRHARYEHMTQSWMLRHLDPLPRLFHSRQPDQAPQEYKLAVLNANPSIRLYVESDLDQALFIDKNTVTGCKVVQFDGWLQALLAREIT